MTDETILYISDQTANSNPVLAALKATGYQVVSTSSTTQAIALLYILHRVAGVVLNRRMREQQTSDLTRSLHAIRSDVPIVQLCSDRTSRLPTYVDACVSIGQSLEKLATAVRRVLLAKRFQLLVAQL